MHRVAATILLLALAASCGDDDAPAADAAEELDAAPSPDAAPLPDAAPRPDATPPKAGDHCGVPIELGAAPATEAGSTAGYGSAFAGSCSADSAARSDIVYHTDLGETPLDLIVDVTVDEAADPPFDVVLHARSDCPASGTELGCSDSGRGEHLEVLAAAGDVFVIVDGTKQYGGASAGDFTLTTATRAIVGDAASCDPNGLTNRCETGFRCVGGVCTADSAALGCSEAPDLTGALAGGTVTVDGHTAPYEGDFYSGSCAADAAASFPERVFAFTVAADSALDASTDHPETDFDTYLYLRSDSCDGAEVECHDDVDVSAFNLRSHLVVPSLPPGTYYLFLDGSSAAPGTGTYRLTVSLTPL